MSARDAQTWGATAGVRAAEAAVRAVDASNFPTCERGGCDHRWHGLKCKACDCETSWTDEGMSA